MEKVTKDLALKKHVGSIHCSNTLSLLQRKISNVLLYHAYNELLEKEEHEIAVKTLCGLIGYSSHDYDTIKKALKALISTVLEWNLLGDTKTSGSEDWNASSILSSVGIRGGICTYSYSNRLKKLLYMPEVYGRINITVQARFKSNYALALYENCIRYQNLPATRWFALATFRKLMGVPDTKYAIFRDFKRRVIDKSVAEVNAFSDIKVEPEIEREGHRVHRIRFKLKQTETQAMDKLHLEQAPEGRGIMDKIVALGVAESQAKKIIEEYDDFFIEEKIEMIKASPAYHFKKVHNISAYLKSALKENYTSNRPVNHSKGQKSDIQEKNEETLKKEYAEYIGNQIDQTFEQLEVTTQNNLEKEFENYLRINNNTFVLEKYYNKGFSNRIVKSMFRNFIREQFGTLLPHFESLIEYKKRKLISHH